MKKIIISTAISLFFSFHCFGWGVYGAVYQNPVIGHTVMVIGDYHQVGLVENQETIFKSIFNQYLRSMQARQKPVVILVESNEEYFNRLKAETKKGTISSDQFSVIDILTLIANQSDLFVKSFLNQYQIIGFPSAILTDYRRRSIKQINNLFVDHLEKAAQVLCGKLMNLSLPQEIRYQLPKNELLCTNEFLFNSYLHDVLAIKGNDTIMLFKNLIADFIKNVGYPFYSIQDLMNELHTLYAQINALLTTPSISPSIKNFLQGQDIFLQSLIQKVTSLFPDPTKSIIDAVVDLGVEWRDIAALTDIGHESNIYYSTNRQMKELYFEILDSLVEIIGDIGMLVELIKAIDQKSDVILYAGIHHIERIEQLLLDSGYQELIKFDNIPSLQPLNQNQLNTLFTNFNL